MSGSRGKSQPSPVVSTDSEEPSMTESLPAGSETVEAMPLAKRYDALATLISQSDNTSDLFKLASSADFRAASTTLVPADLKRLRELYVARKNDLDGKTRLDEFDGSVIVITDVQFWKTDKYLDKNPSGEGVTLTYHPESDPLRRCRSMTSSAIVRRFAGNICDPTPPSASDPARAYIELVPVRDPKRAAEGQKQWQFRLLPTLTRDNGEAGSPF